MSQSQIPTPKLYPIGSKKSLAQVNQLIVLKEKTNVDVKTPQQINRKKPFFGITDSTDKSKFSASKLKPNNDKLCTPVHSSISKLATTPRQNMHFESHMTGGSVTKHNQLKSSAVKEPSHSSTFVVSNKLAPKPSTTKQNEIPNPIVNGVDYTEMILKKPQLGYSGLGYIVEFNCDPKYLRGVVVQKGLWRLYSPDYKPSDDCLDLGPPIYLTRIDCNEKNTPGKLTMYEFGWRPKLINTVEKNYNETTQNLNLETQPKAKKALRWATNLENIDESAQNKHSPHDVDLDVASKPPKSKMRKSFSHSEIVGLDVKQNLQCKYDDNSLIEDVMPLRIGSDNHESVINSTLTEHEISNTHSTNNKATATFTISASQEDLSIVKCSDNNSSIQSQSLIQSQNNNCLDDIVIEKINEFVQFMSSIEHIECKNTLKHLSLTNCVNRLVTESSELLKRASVPKQNNLT